MICIVYVTKKGKIKISSADEVRVMGRLAKGMIGMNLDAGDEVIASFLIDREVEPKSSPTVTTSTPEPASPEDTEETTEAPAEDGPEDAHGRKPFPATGPFD